MAKLLDWLSRGYDQINPFDNGRTFKQRTPTNNQSLLQQATHNGLTNVVGNSVVKPLVRSGLAVNQGIGNLERKIAGRPTLNTAQFLAQPGIGMFGANSEYTGTKRQIAGDIISNVANIAAPGSSKFVQSGVTGLLPRVTPKIISKTIAGAATGAPVGAVSNVSSYIGSDQPLNAKGFLRSAGQGAAYGAVGGAAIPVVGAGVRKVLQKTTRPVYAHEGSRLPEASDGQANLPTIKTRREGNFSKALRSTRSVIERQGQSGKELGGLLQQSRDTQELFLASIQKALPTVRRLKGKNFENFVDSTQGLATPNSPRVAQAVREWQAVHPGIRERAVAAGLDVGDLGPNYYPHFIDYERVFKDNNRYNEAINHLVKTGQASTPEDAIKLLGYARDVSRNRQFGNLEASRLVDLPFYDKTPNSLISYLSGSGKRIAQTETFGAKDENALRLIKKIGLEGGDTEAAKNAYDIAVGAKQYNPTSSKISQNIRRYVTTTRLGLGALTNISQNANTGIVTGHLRTLGAAFKQLSPKTRAFVGDTGVIADAVLNDIRTQSGYANFAQRSVGKVVNKITAPFFGTVEKLNRSIAATAGRDYGLRLAQKGNEKVLRKLGVTGPVENRTLTPDQQIQVARKVVEKTQFKVDPQDLPGWADTPGGKLVSQFRTFSYNQSKFISNEVLKPALKGNLLPLSRLLAALPVGYALYETKRAISGRPEEENKTKIGLQAFQNVGGAGLVFDLYQSLNPIGSKYLPPDRRTSMAVGAVGGPAIGVAAQGVGALSEAIQRKNTPKDESRLAGKVALGKTPEDYTDLTSAARFALQQIPIVGTPIKNRVLPYKQESNADAGKTAATQAPDTITRKTASGRTVKTPKIDYEHQLNRETLTQQKNANDVQGWLNTANGQIENIKTQLKNPSIDPLDALRLKNEAQTLMTNISKYQAYGGFVKPKISRPKRAKSKRPRVRIPKIIGTTTAIKLPSLPKIAIKKASFKVPSVRKISVNKIPKAQGRQTA